MERSGLLTNKPRQYFEAFNSAKSIHDQVRLLGTLESCQSVLLG